MANSKIEIRPTGRYGKGVFAVSRIFRDELIAEYDGPVYAEDYAFWTPDLEDHVIQFEENLWRATEGLAQFINHSCEPNCGVMNRFQFVAMRDIEPGEELTYDYEMTENHPEWKMRCRCGQPSCRNIVGEYKNMPQPVRDKYEGYVSEWLVKANQCRGGKDESSDPLG